MLAEPFTNRSVSLFDGHNLYRRVNDASRHHHLNYDPRRLADAVCADPKRPGLRLPRSTDYQSMTRECAPCQRIPPTRVIWANQYNR